MAGIVEVGAESWLGQQRASSPVLPAVLQLSVLPLCFSEDGDPDGEAGDLDGSHTSSGLLSHASGQLESPLPPHSNMDLNKQGEPHSCCGDGGGLDT